MTNRDSKGKFTKAAPFKVGDRVRVVKKTSPLSFATPVEIGFLGTILGGIDTYDDGTYRCDVTFDKTGSTTWATRCSDLCLADAPAAPGTETISPGLLHRTEAELRDAMAEVATLNADLDLQKRIAEAALFREKAEARRAVAAESKLADIAALRRAMEIMGSIQQEGGVSFSDAIDAVLARK